MADTIAEARTDLTEVITKLVQAASNEAAGTSFPDEALEEVMVDYWPEVEKAIDFFENTVDCEGYAHGKRVGEDEADDARNEGYRHGQEAGFKEGRLKGYEEGYKEGYADAP